MASVNDINTSCVPNHVAVIMDGNGRWAKSLGKERIFGHRSGVKSVRECIEAAAEAGVKFLTLYTFSTENWNRPQIEVNALMSLLVSSLRDEVNSLNKNNISIRAIGDIEKLPSKAQSQLKKAIELTKDNTHLILILALNYSGRWDINNATKNIALDYKKGLLSEDELIKPETINRYLATHEFPDPELMIRTSGESRISNFLIWQLAYAELYFTKINWPDFRKKDFFEAIYNYQNRERRFGLTSEQLQQNQ